MLPGKYYGQYYPEVDKVIFENFFPLESHQGEKFIALECGAADGLYLSSCKFFEESRGWQCINIEPDPDLFKDLTKNRPKSININAALSDASGEHEFTRTIWPDGKIEVAGSLHHCQKQIDQLRDWWKATLVKTKVKCLTYPQLLSKIGVDHIDLMVLDVEGHEAQVLSSFSKDVPMPRILCVETDWVTTKEIDDILLPIGYQFRFTFRSNSFYQLMA